MLKVPTAENRSKPRVRKTAQTSLSNRLISSTPAKRPALAGKARHPAADQPVKPRERAEFFRDIVRERPGVAIPTSELLALALPEHQSIQCPLCDRPYMLRNGCPCIRDATPDPPPAWTPV